MRSARGSGVVIRPRSPVRLRQTILHAVNPLLAAIRHLLFCKSLERSLPVVAWMNALPRLSLGKQKQTDASVSMPYLKKQKALAKQENYLEKYVLTIYSI